MAGPELSRVDGAVPSAGVSSRQQLTSFARRPGVVAMAVLTIVLGFGLGFGLAGRGASGPTPTDPLTAAPAGTVREAVVSEPPEDTVTAPAPSTTAADPSSIDSVTVAPPTITAAPPTAPPPVPSTVAPTTATIRTVVPTTGVAATTPAPPRVVASFAADASGRLVIPRGGTATVEIRNEGGLASQYVVTGTGFTFGGAASQGTLEPGARVTLVVAPPRSELPATDVVGVISVLGAVNGSIPFVIPAP